MSERLTDEDLASLQRDIDNENPDQPIRRRVTRALAELRVLRLSAEDREAIRILRRHIPMWFREDSDECGTHENRARAVLDRLLAQGENK